MVKPKDMPDVERALTVRLRDELAMLVSPTRGMATDSSGEVHEQRALPNESPLQLEEVSQLLQQREARGYMAGQGKGYREARRHVVYQLQRARNEAVAGTLMMVVGQLEDVLHELAKQGEEGKHEAAKRLAVLTTELARAAERYAGEEQGEETGF